jgi:hypothetical protein
VWAGEVAEGDAHRNALVGLVLQGFQDGGVLGEEQGAEGEDADVVLGVGEQAMPYVGGHGGAVRVGQAQFVVRGVGSGYGDGAGP